MPRLARASCAILVFGFAGPPIGGIIAWLGMGAATMRSPLPFITGSWLEGSALAFTTGLVTAAAAWRGKSSWIVPVAAAFLITASFIVATAGGDGQAMLRVGKVLVPPAIVAALACWLLTRRLLRR